MKKNRMMRLASALLVAVLLTTCAISGTFAKYVTTASASDSARVAKWGVTVTASADDAFTPTYASNTTGVSGNTVVSADENADGVANDDDVLAPGTSGHLGQVTMTGTPEVMVDVAVTADLELSGWVIDGSTEYCPVVFTIGTETYGTIAGVDHQSTDIADLEADIEALLNNTGDNIPANTNLASTYNFDIEWAWAFDGDDVSDTKLGNLATAPTIEFTYSASVTQVD